MYQQITIRHEDFDVGAEWQGLRARLGGSAGAMAAFCGVVRDQFGADAIDTLELEHYPGMTERSIERILADAGSRWTLDACVVIHRVGPLRPADQIVLVMIAARHRGEALAACQFVIDLLKTDAVFWKRERSQSRTRWVDSSQADHERAAEWTALDRAGAKRKPSS
jgi:molybdopterin synthase catalytic subunit